MKHFGQSTNASSSVRDSGSYAMHVQKVVREHLVRWDAACCERSEHRVVGINYRRELEATANVSARWVAAQPPGRALAVVRGLWSTARVVRMLLPILVIALLASFRYAHAGVGAARLDGMTVISAPTISKTFEAQNPGARFQEGTKEIVFLFTSQRAGASGGHAVEFELYGIASRTRLTPDRQSFTVPNGDKFVLTMPVDTLEPGKYRLALRSGQASDDLEFEIVAKHPRALDASTVVEASIKLSDGRKVTQRTLTLPDATKLDLSGPNIAAAARGGRVLHVSSETQNELWSAQRLIDGVGVIKVTQDPERCHRCGWMTNYGDGKREVTLSFLDSKEAAIAAVIVETNSAGFQKGISQEQRLSTFPKIVAVSVSSNAKDAAFKEVVRATISKQEGRHVIPLPVGTRARQVKVAILETHGAPITALAEIEVIEANIAGSSILQGASNDLASIANGGHLVGFTRFQGNNVPANLFDPDGIKTWWQSADDYFPQILTVAFQGNQSAMVRQVALEVPAAVSDVTWPSEVSISVSKHHPMDGFEEIGRFTVPKTAGPHAFAVNREARYVRVRVLNNHGGQYTTISRLAVLEGTRAGYTPIHLRMGKDFKETRLSSRVSEAPQAPLFRSATPEIEPNDAKKNATPLQLNTAVHGQISPLGETDQFQLRGMPPAGAMVTIDYAGHPYIRTGYDITTPDGKVVAHLDPGDVPAAEIKRSYSLPAGPLFVSTTEPASSVVIIWDTSGSMTGRDKDLERAVREYIEAAASDQRMGLIRFSNEPSVVLGERGFTSDKGVLLKALAGQFVPDGGTSFYDAVAKGIDLLDGVKGNRAIILMTDGVDTASRQLPEALWRKLENKRIRVHTIGVGRSLQDYSFELASTGEALLQSMALATGGEAFFSTESGALKTLYGRISKELSRPALYAIRLILETGHGTLKVNTVGEQLPGKARPAVEVILDASGSMVEKLPNGRRRWDVAVETVLGVIEELDEHTSFRLTVYGSKIPEARGKQYACSDIESWGTQEGTLRHAKPAFRKFIRGLQPRGGTTPMSKSVEAVARSFKGSNGGIIILITDGIEECDADPKGTIKRLKAGAMKNLSLNLVRFNVREQSAKVLMEALAEAGEGRVFDANDGASLARALREAMAAIYSVKDGNGKTVASGRVDGPAIAVPAGWFDVEIQAADAPIRRTQVRIEDRDVTRIRVNKAGREVDVVVEAPKSLPK